jgi:hypothetical protein
MKWARMRTERVAAISAMDRAAAAEALREAIAGVAPGVHCTDCGVAFDVLGDLAAALGSPCPDCGGALEPEP